MGVGGQRHVPAAHLPPPRHRDPVPLYRTLGGPQRRSGRVRKISSPPATYPRPVQLVASRNTDWAISARGIPVQTLLISRCCATVTVKRLLMTYWCNTWIANDKKETSFGVLSAVLLIVECSVTWRRDATFRRIVLCLVALP
jgi:hypothetical protein